MKTIMLLLVLMAGAAWGQTQICKTCPSAADMDRQLYPRLPKNKPEKAKLQRPSKQARKKAAAAARYQPPAPSPVPPAVSAAPASANPSTRGSGS